MKPPATGFDLDVGAASGSWSGRIDYAGWAPTGPPVSSASDALLPIPATLSFAEGAGFWLATLTAMAGLHAGGLDSETGPREARSGDRGLERRGGR